MCFTVLSEKQLTFLFTSLWWMFHHCACVSLISLISETHAIMYVSMFSPKHLTILFPYQQRAFTISLFSRLTIPCVCLTIPRPVSPSVLSVMSVYFTILWVSHYSVSVSKFSECLTILSMSHHSVSHQSMCVSPFSISHHSQYLTIHWVSHYLCIVDQSMCLTIVSISPFSVYLIICVLLTSLCLTILNISPFFEYLIICVLLTSLCVSSFSISHHSLSISSSAYGWPVSVSHHSQYLTILWVSHHLCIADQSLCLIILNISPFSEYLIICVWLTSLCVSPFSISHHSLCISLSVYGWPFSECLTILNISPFSISHHSMCISLSVYWWPVSVSHHSQYLTILCASHSYVVQHSPHVSLFSMCVSSFSVCLTVIWFSHHSLSTRHSLCVILFSESLTILCASPFIEFLTILHVSHHPLCISPFSVYLIRYVGIVLQVGLKEYRCLKMSFYYR